MLTLNRDLLVVLRRLFGLMCAFCAIGFKFGNGPDQYGDRTITLLTVLGGWHDAEMVRLCFFILSFPSCIEMVEVG